MSIRLRIAAAGLVIGGVLFAAAMVLSLAGRGFPIVAFIVGWLLSGVSLPFVVHRPNLRSRRLAAAGTAVVLVALALGLVINTGLVLELAAWGGVLLQEATWGAGRRAVPVVLGVGLVALAASWNRASDDMPVVMALLVVGVSGIMLAFSPEGLRYGIWYLVLGALWVFLGLATWLDARQAGRV